MIRAHDQGVEDTSRERYQQNITLLLQTVKQRTHQNHNARKNPIEIRSEHTIFTNLGESWLSDPCVESWEAQQRGSLKKNFSPENKRQHTIQSFATSSSSETDGATFYPNFGRQPRLVKCKYVQSKLGSHQFEPLTVIPLPQKINEIWGTRCLVILVDF